VRDGGKAFLERDEFSGPTASDFIRGKSRGPAFRFKAPISIMDSTVVELVANSMDWAKHRRRKAAAKTHMRLSLQSLLRSASSLTRPRSMTTTGPRTCAGLEEGKSPYSTRLISTMGICWT